MTLGGGGGAQLASLVVVDAGLAPSDALNAANLERVLVARLQRVYAESER